MSDIEALDRLEVPEKNVLAFMHDEIVERYYHPFKMLYRTAHELESVILFMNKLKGFLLIRPRSQCRHFIYYRRVEVCGTQPVQFSWRLAVLLLWIIPY